MSLGNCHLVQYDGLDDCYNSLPVGWQGPGAPPFEGVTLPYCTDSFVSTATLTPISLPDIPIVNQNLSPALGQQSPDYQHQNSRDSVPQFGLGISAPFSSDFPQTVTAGASFAETGMTQPYSKDDQSVQPLEHRSAKRMHRDPQKLPTPREAPVTILPHPEGLERLKQERQQKQPSLVQRPRPRAPGRVRRNPRAEEEDTYVESLRNQNLAWKVIREKFREKFNKDATVARLQMRMSRRRNERLARWNECDIQLLLAARDLWREEKYQFIAEKMKELGARRIYTPEQCEYQLQILNSSAAQRGTGSPELPQSRKRRRETSQHL